jgi:hypothetical protein
MKCNEFSFSSSAGVDSNEKVGLVLPLNLQVWDKFALLHPNDVMMAQVSKY